MEQIKQNYNKYKQIKEENLLLQSAFKVKMKDFFSVFLSISKYILFS
jgi:hypothetical protein